MTAYYNEIDPKAAAWLRELIAQNLVAPGEVDERDIQDITPADLRGFTQCHFFAGIGVWSYALRRAGWSDDRPVWTGSCPCQPFSAAGKGGGFDDERHLWPAFHWLIEQCAPGVVFGEQVASKDGLGWLDLVQADLEGSGYASGAVDLCAAGVGAPHIRQRLWWFGERLEHAPGDGRVEWRAEPSGRGAASGRSAIGLADSDMQRKRSAGDETGSRDLAGAGEIVGLADCTEQGREPWRRDRRSGDGGGPARHELGRLRDAGGMADSVGYGRREGRDRDYSRDERAQLDTSRGDDRPGPTNGVWGDADWLHCRDLKWRPVEPGTFPLAHGAPARVGRLRGYGNAINAEAAAAFIQSYLETA